MAYLTPAEAAVRLGVCKVTILRRIRDKSIHAVRLGKRTLKISEDELNEYIEKSSTKYDE